MQLTEQKLSEWTGLKGRDLCIFYLMYKKQALNILHSDLNAVKEDIIAFKNNIFQNKIDKENIGNVSDMIKFWESKHKEFQ